MSPQQKIGFIGLDTSHVSAFAKLLNDPSDPHHVPGGKVVCAWPGGSEDFALSIDRVAGFTKELKEQRGVAILDTPEAVADACDLVFIESVDGRVHLPLFERIAKFKKPVFIDKPLTTNLADAKKLLHLAQNSGVTVMSCSSLRYSQGVSEALSSGRDDIRACDIFGPLDEQSTQPGWFWYGCHTIEMLVAVMGVGCREVRCFRNADNDLLTAIFADGRVASVRGARNTHHKFGLTIHRDTGASYIDASAGTPFYAGLLKAIMANLPHNRSAVPVEEMLKIVQIIEAANESRARDGAAVTL